MNGISARATWTKGAMHSADDGRGYDDDDDKHHKLTGLTDTRLFSLLNKSFRKFNILLPGRSLVTPLSSSIQLKLDAQLLFSTWQP
jgi:hypothetical protein